MVGSLHRKAANYRKLALGRLSKLPPAECLEACNSLLAQKNVKKRAAALELLEPLLKQEQWADRVRDLVEPHKESLQQEPELSAVASKILGSAQPEYTFDDCLGLVQPDSRAEPVPLHPKDITLKSKAGAACLISLAELFLEHAEDEIPNPRGEAVLISRSFPRPRIGSDGSPVTRESLLERLPLRDVWLKWNRKRTSSMRDDDGLELIRAWFYARTNRNEIEKKLPAAFRGSNWQFNNAFMSLVDWLPLFEPHENAHEYVVDIVEDKLARFDREKDILPPESRWDDPKTLVASYIADAISYLAWYPSTLPDRITQLRSRLAAYQMRALDLEIPGCVTGPSLEHFADAYDAGMLNAYDFAALLLKKRTNAGRFSGAKFGPLDKVTSAHPHPILVDRPELAKMAHATRDRVIEIELTRGEQASIVTDLAERIRHAGGADVLFRLLKALGKDNLVRNSEWGQPSRAYSFCRLISSTFPGDEDTVEHFAELYASSGLSAKRLIELAMYAPQWSGHVEHATESIGLEDAVWWTHAHTKNSHDWRGSETRDKWAARINERTELDADDLEQGAVDSAWFRRLIDRIGGDTWDAYLKPAKYASSSGGHKRATLFADTMLGRLRAEELIERIEIKRNQDAVRALGLVPLPKKRADAKAETLRRFKILQEFKRKSRTFGSQRQASEGLAVEIGMQNLARTAGYRDPQRLRWSMEAEAVSDLAKGPVTIRVEETSVALSIDSAGDPVLSVVKKDKPLKNVPAKLRKNKDIAEFRARVTELRKQKSRMRLSLEESMCRGDVFSSEELARFMQHPMLRPLVERLVFLLASDRSSDLIGYPDQNGKVLRSHDGSVEALGKKDLVRLAHPTDFYARSDWHVWQKECFAAERVQPFKQIFRELYPLTDSERGTTNVSHRYAGHQVNPRQALSLLKAKQWLFSPDTGVRRVDHSEGIAAELYFEEHFYTPAEVEGLTLEGVGFFPQKRGAEALTLSDIPERLVSETMRDLDLVVSVAHAGGVDPETSESTVEMRAALLQETCSLLGIGNIRVKGRHAHIEGTRAKYSLHLGSASTQVMPGRTLVIVAVHSQHRGRIFLPFADDDPKTAEVIAKALLLARDKDIKDPSILQQIDM